MLSLPARRHGRDEYRFLLKDGRYANVQDRGYVVRNAAGRGIRMVGGMTDLTERKKLEAQYLRAQRMESIGTLAGGVAHDLNNVLSPIMMAIDLLKLDASGNPKRLQLLDTIRASARRGADLVRQVLSFARGLEGERIAVDLHHLVDDLRGIITETFPRKITIETEIPSNLWPIIGDATQIHQVLLNLAVNARDAMPEGGTLTFAADNLEVDAQYAGTGQEVRPGPYVMIAVTDTGTGMPPEVRDRIFEPFFTTKEIGKGTGLGLSTVHAITKSHGGFLTVDSEMGHGTTFKVFLPADRELARIAAENAPVDVPRGRGELVLVVDDEESIRSITQQTLEAFGYRVLTASDGAEAVAVFAQHTGETALVLIDMAMPVLDGPTAIHALLHHSTRSAHRRCERARLQCHRRQGRRGRREGFSAQTLHGGSHVAPDSGGVGPACNRPGVLSRLDGSAAGVLLASACSRDFHRHARFHLGDFASRGYPTTGGRPDAGRQSGHLDRRHP